jgi:hypothetical protein
VPAPLPRPVSFPFGCPKTALISSPLTLLANLAGVQGAALLRPLPYPPDSWQLTTCLENHNYLKSSSLKVSKIPAQKKDEGKLVNILTCLGA